MGQAGLRANASTTTIGHGLDAPVNSQEPIIEVREITVNNYGEPAYGVPVHEITVDDDTGSHYPESSYDEQEDNE